MDRDWNLFLDDYRIPTDAAKYMFRRIGKENVIYIENKWIIVKNYEQFVNQIKKRGLPKIVSFDHDLSDLHYQVSFEDWEDYTSEQLGVEKTGADCAKWLKDYCNKNNLKLPVCYIHSMNPVGSQNILNILNGRTLVNNRANL